ncbi:MAG TPA: type II toxin-antitoxin system RelE/ParE family toxin [Candidatus Binataceae bacterium]|nr:type II toxin-antitoxin system RelE/ParE family toxin [Candidatus Binataceae bacterium]
MIRGFRHRPLEELFRKGRGGKVAASLRSRVLRRLDALEHAAALRDLNIPGFDFHPLKGKPQRYSLHVNGPWCITFEWRDGDAWSVAMEQYH